MKKLIPALLLNLACNSLPPPAAITVNASTPDVVARSIVVARDAWCVADVGWCPEIVEWGGAEVVVTRWDGAGKPGGPGETLEETGWIGPAAHADAWRVEVVPEFVTDLDLPGVLAHEFGHFCLDGHVGASALMRPEHVDPIQPIVDAAAASAWRRHCP